MEQILPTIDMINTVAIYRVWHLNGLAEFLGQYGLAEFSQWVSRVFTNPQASSDRNQQCCCVMLCEGSPPVSYRKPVWFIERESLLAAMTRMIHRWFQVAGIVKCVPSEADEIGGADATRGAF